VLVDGDQIYGYIIIAKETTASKKEDGCGGMIEMKSVNLRALGCVSGWGSGVREPASAPFTRD